MISRAKAYQLRRMIEKASASLSDGDAYGVPELFPSWASGVFYTVNDRIRYEGILYKVLQNHTSQDNWTPDVTPALWTVVSLDEFPEWVQPTGAQDAYRFGYKVSHNDKHWVNTLDYNTYEPGVYGWDEIV